MCASHDAVLILCMCNSSEVSRLDMALPGAEIDSSLTEELLGVDAKPIQNGSMHSNSLYKH